MSDITQLCLIAGEDALQTANEIQNKHEPADAAHIMRAIAGVYILKLAQLDTVAAVQFIQRLDRMIVPRETQNRPRLAAVNGDIVS